MMCTSNRPVMRGAAGGCSLSCARFPSFCSHFTLSSSQWQRAFTAQLTYAACLHPAGVSHPDERIPPLTLFFGFHGGSNIYYFIILLNSLRLLMTGLVSEVSRWNKINKNARQGLPALRSPPPLELVTDPRHPTSPSPHPFFPFIVDVQVRFTILSDTLYSLHAAATW